MNHIHQVQSTKDSSLDVSPKKRGRPAKSKEGHVLPAHTQENPYGKEVTGTELDDSLALNSGPTMEDLEFDRRLQEMNNEEMSAEPVTDIDPGAKEAKRKSNLTLLTEVEKRPPADKPGSLKDLLFLAKSHSVDAVEATKEVMKFYLRHKS